MEKISEQNLREDYWRFCYSHDKHAGQYYSLGNIIGDVIADC